MGITARRRLKDIDRLSDFEAASRHYLPRAIFEYIRNGAGDEISLRRNRAVFDRWLWRPHRLNDVTRVSTNIRLFGEDYDLPFGIAPTGGAAVMRYDADRIEAREACRANVPYALSANSITPLEDIIRINPKSWFAAYLPSDEDVIDGIVDRVGRAGYRVLMITIDVPVAARRVAEIRAGYTMPIRLNWPAFAGGVARPGWIVGTLARTMIRTPNPRILNVLPEGGPGIFSREIGSVGGAAGFTWAHVARIRECWRGALVLKGILRGDDAARAATLGVDGIVVSDHGARLLDSAVAPLEVLGEVKAQAGEMTVLVDSGFRNGGDVLKGLALGADGVLIGRPMAQACALAGRDGVAFAIEMLGEEIRRTLGMLGVVGVETLSEAFLHDAGMV